MTPLVISKQGEGHFRVEGDMTFATIGAQLATLFTFLVPAKRVTIDLGQVASADSAGLALLVEWKKIARSQKCQLALKNIPEQLHMLANLSGFDLASHFIIQTDS